jgi:hypothetical protein
MGMEGAPSFYESSKSLPYLDSASLDALEASRDATNGEITAPGTYGEQNIPTENAGPNIGLSYGDEELHAAVIDPEGSIALYATDKILWIRSAIAADSGIGASEVSDDALAQAYNDGGFAEWDPNVSAHVRNYLHGQGYLGLRGTARPDQAE